MLSVGGYSMGKKQDSGLLNLIGFAQKIYSFIFKKNQLAGLF